MNLHTTCHMQISQTECYTPHFSKLNALSDTAWLKVDFQSQGHNFFQKVDFTRLYPTVSRLYLGGGDLTQKPTFR